MQVFLHNINRLELFTYRTISNMHIPDGNGQFSFFSEHGSLDIPYLYSVSLLAKLCEVFLKFPMELIKIFGLFKFM